MATAHQQPAPGDRREAEQWTPAGPWRLVLGRVSGAVRTLVGSRQLVPVPGFGDLEQLVLLCLTFFK